MASNLSVAFNNGVKCPLIGFGTWRARGEDAYKAVKHAIEVGYRHIDTAFVYQNENEVGRAINDTIKAGLIKRDDIFVVSKLSSTNHKENMVVPAIRKSLDNLQLEYLDLFLIHAPWSTIPEVEGQVCLNSKKTPDGKDVLDDIDPAETWRGMEQCVKLGLARSIGLSNFNSKQTEDIMQICTIKPVTNQVELHHLLNQEKLKRFSEERGITLTAYRSLGGAKNIHKVLSDEKICSLATKYQKSPAQIILKWVMQRGIIAIPKSVTPKRIEENLAASNFTISDEDMAYISSMDTNTRYCEFLDSKDSKYFPFHEGVEY